MGVFKNEVGRPSNETIKKRNIFKGICALLVIVVIGLVGYILNDKGIINLSNNKNGNNEVDTEKKESKELDEKDKDKVIDLYNKINYLTSTLGVYTRDGSMDYWNYFYTFDKINVSDVDNDMKLALAFSRYFIDNFDLKSDDMEKRIEAEQKILEHTADSSKINEKYKELFGEEISDYNINVEVLGYSIKYNPSKHNYSFDSAGVGEVSWATVITKVIDTKVNNNKVEVISKALFAAASPDGMGIYKNVRLNDYRKLNSECSKSKENFCYYGVLDELEFFDGENAPNIDDISINKYIDKLNSYKWTFIKNKDGNYTLESVEKVK